MAGHTGRSTVWILNKRATGIDFSLKWRHGKKQCPSPLKSCACFLGRSPPSLILTTCAGAPSLDSTFFRALMRKLCVSSSLLLEACSAASYLVTSSPSVRGTKAGRVSAKADQLHDFAVAFPASVPRSFASLCSQAPTLSLLFLNVEEQKKKKKKVLLWGPRLHGAAWLSDLTGTAPLFRQKSLTCTHSEKSVAQPAGPSGRRAGKKVGCSRRQSVYTVWRLSAALCCRRVTRQNLRLSSASCLKVQCVIF